MTSDRKRANVNVKIKDLFEHPKIPISGDFHTDGTIS